MSTRERISINSDWRFMKYDSAELADNLIYDVRPAIEDPNDVKPADSKPTEAVEVTAKRSVLKPWIMPTGNRFLKDTAYVRPEGNPGADFPFVQADFDDSGWENLNLPHDWAVKGPFYEGWGTEVGGGMGRLPSQGIAWYRKKINIPASDEGKSIFLDMDGAMSYAMVWLNGQLVGGWPFGYSSWRLDLTPYINFAGENQLAIRLDNPNNSSRWYPGGGIYRNVWLTKTQPVHVGQWGTYITSSELSEKVATIDIETSVDNAGQKDATIEVLTELFELDVNDSKSSTPIVHSKATLQITSGESAVTKSSLVVQNPKLWGPPPTQSPNRYVAVTTLMSGNQIVDQYETPFGIRSLAFDPNQGVLVNGELIKIQGVNQHHDLGALGAAFNTRAAQRQLEMLQEMGCNAIRMAHNPPAPELLELTDKMGFLVVDESFDCWYRKKTPHDFHLIFPEWHEQDLRALVRRDRNHPSVIMWSFGNEVGEQYTDTDGAAVARRLRNIVKEEDPTRPTTSAMNWAKPDMPLPAELDLISLNYQGEGIRQDPMFEGTDRIRTTPQYIPNHEAFPDKVILSSETSSAFSSRGIYYFPVTDKISDITRDGRGGNSEAGFVSSYELHAVDFGSSADRVFGQLARHPFVAGQFVWTGWDHLGEPTPYYLSRSSYCGIIDMAGFKKDRFYLYQSQWRPELPMVHILPHWNWPERVGQVTPVHVFTSGDEAELFLNGKSLGRKKKGEYEYRLRWDEVSYEPGEVKVIAYKNDKEWAEETIKTTGAATQLIATADRSEIQADGTDLSFVAVRIADTEGLTVPLSTNKITFSIEGPGEIVATDNGNPTDMVALSSKERNAFSGLCMAIVRSLPDQSGKIKVTVSTADLTEASVEIQSNK